MRELTALTGEISELQGFNLKMFPFIVFNGIREVKLNFDFSEKKAGIVDYLLTFNRGTRSLPQKEKIPYLEKMVREILWNDTIVKVQKTGKPWI